MIGGLKDHLDTALVRENRIIFEQLVIETPVNIGGQQQYAEYKSLKPDTPEMRGRGRYRHTTPFLPDRYTLSLRRSLTRGNLLALGITARKAVQNT